MKAVATEVESSKAGLITQSVDLATSITDILRAMTTVATEDESFKAGLIAQPEGKDLSHLLLFFFHIENMLIAMALRKKNVVVFGFGRRDPIGAFYPMVILVYNH